MAGLLDVAYSVLVVLVALGGFAFVFSATGSDESGDAEGTRWSQWALAVVAVAFLAVMVAGLVT